MDDALAPAILQHLLRAETRFSLWAGFLNHIRAEVVAEIGVHRGDFAAALLAQCPPIKKYYLIDPWRHLPDWDKPCNATDQQQEEHYARTGEQTAAYRDRVCILRGTTLEVIQRIPDAALDFCYIDGDHTLRGITIDLICATPKVRSGGWIGGDDFHTSIWQHGPEYEPTLVCPYAVHFAEAMQMKILALPHAQFLLRVQPRGRFEFSDPIGTYGDLSLKRQCRS
jgi:hypothetical protein